MPVIILALKGGTGDIELRTVGWRIKGQVITKVSAGEDGEQQKEGREIDSGEISFNQILKSLDREGSQDYDDLRYKHIRLSRSENEIADFFQSSDEAFRLLMMRLEDGMPDNYFVFGEILTGADEFNFVKAGADYWISRVCVPLHHEILERFGDVGECCRFSPMEKTFMFHHLFAAICSMRRTLVLNITERTLRIWWRYLRYLHDAHFGVEPLVDNLKRLVHTYFGLQVRKFGEDLDGQIAQLSQEIRDKEAELERVKAERERYLHRAMGEKTSLMKKCLSEPSALQWRTAGDLLL